MSGITDFDISCRQSTWSVALPLGILGRRSLLEMTTTYPLPPGQSLPLRPWSALCSRLASAFFATCHVPPWNECSLSDASLLHPLHATPAALAFIQILITFTRSCFILALYCLFFSVPPGFYVIKTDLLWVSLYSETSILPHAWRGKQSSPLGLWFLSYNTLPSYLCSLKF